MKGNIDRMGLVLEAFDAVHDGVILLDDTGVALGANRWLTDRLSDRAPLVGRRLDEIFPEMSDCRPGFDPEHLADACGPFLLSDHGDGWLEMSFSALDGGDEGSTGIAHVRDVTERVRAEEALRDEVLRRRLLVEQSRDGIVVLDESGAVDEANEEFARMLGYTPEEAAALHVWDWEADVPRERLLEMLAAVDVGGDHFETRHRRKDGSLYDVEISTNGAVFGGRKYIFCVCRDISQRNREVADREKLILDLRSALEEIKTLRGIVPICSYCHKVRDDEGFWEQVDVYIRRQSGVSVSHGICPECMGRLYPELCEPEGQAEA